MSQPGQRSPGQLSMDVRPELDGADSIGVDPTCLAVLDGLPVAEHASAYAALHERLQETLAHLDQV